LEKISTHELMPKRVKFADECAFCRRLKTFGGPRCLGRCASHPKPERVPALPDGLTVAISLRSL
jgi:hypothetical protein